MTDIPHTCHRCGDPFLGSAAGPRIRYCSECKPLIRRATFRAYWDRWPLARRQAHWRAQKAKQRARQAPGEPYHKRKASVLRRAMRGEG